VTIHRQIEIKLRHACVSQCVVNRFVNGKRSIDLETAAKLCEYLRLDLHRRK